MSETKQQQPAAAPAPAKPRKAWELFWRIVAGLMLLVIAWVVWVLYQITPRSVVTPLAYESQFKRSAAPEAGAATPAASTPAASTPPDAAAAALRMDGAQAAMRSGAHQSSADAQARALEQGIEPLREERLKLSTEIGTPPVERTSISKQQEARP